MVIFACILLIILICGSSLITLLYAWKRREFRSLFVQLVVVFFSIAGGIYAIVHYPDVFSIAKALNYLSPLKMR